MARREIGRTGARFGAPARRGQHAPDPERTHGHPADDPVEPAAATTPAPDPDDGADGVGLTGARFGGRARRSRPGKDAAPPEPAGAAPTTDPAPGRTDVAARTGAPERAADGADGGVPAGAVPAGAAETTGPLPVTGTPAPRIAARPYVLTGGRTKVRAELRIETMVSTTGRPGPPAPAGAEPGERRAVLAVCARPRSVSEVAALVGVPLGVARVLIDDLATEGRVRVHLGVDAATGPDAALLERVLSGLRRL